MLRRLGKIFSSLWLAVAILVVMAAILISANSLAGYDVTAGSLRRDWYGSLWFLPLLGLLMVNLTVCTIKRKPWRFWQWGFLVTHTGVLTLMIGAGISFQFKIYGDLRLQEGQTSGRFEVEGEHEMLVKSPSGEHRISVDLNLYKRSRPGWAIPIPGTSMFLYLDEFVPNVALQAAYEPDPRGEEDVLEMTSWLPRSKPETFFLREGETWGNEIFEFVYSADPDLHRNLSEAAGEQGTLELTMDGETRTLDVKEHLGKTVRIGKRDVTLKQAISSFTIGPEGDPVDDPSVRGAGPAVVFDVAHEGKAEVYYAFALHPKLTPHTRGGGMHGEGGADFKAALLATPKQSLVWLFALKDGFRYVVTSKSGKRESGALKADDKVKHPFAPMDIFFTVRRRIERASPTVKEEEPKKNRRMIPAVRVRLSDYPDQHAAWIPLYGATRASVKDRDVSITFQPKIYTDLGLEITLLKFRKPTYDGTRQAAKFESDLRVFDKRLERGIEGTTGVNYPLAYGGWLFYQSAFDDTVTPPASVLQVAYDPGKRALYLGFIMTASGTIFMFFLKPHLLKLVQAARKAGDPPMGNVEPLAWLSILSVGTIGGMVSMLGGWIDPFWLGVLMSTAGVVAAFAVALVGVARSATRPGWALQLGQLVSAGWCINTAAFVIYMYLRIDA